MYVGNQGPRLLGFLDTQSFHLSYKIEKNPPLIVTTEINSYSYTVKTYRRYLLKYSVIKKIMLQELKESIELTQFLNDSTSK